MYAAAVPTTPRPSVSPPLMPASASEPLDQRVLTRRSTALSSRPPGSRPNDVVEVHSMDIAAKRTVGAAQPVFQGRSIGVTDHQRDAQATHRRSGSRHLRLRLRVCDPAADWPCVRAPRRQSTRDRHPSGVERRDGWIPVRLRQLGDQRGGTCDRRPLPRRRHRLGLHRLSALLGAAVGAVVAGRAADRFGRLAAMRLAAVLFLISALGTGLVDSLTLLIVFRVIGGVGVGWRRSSRRPTSRRSPQRVSGVGWPRRNGWRSCWGSSWRCWPTMRLRPPPAARITDSGWAWRRGGGCSWR